MPPRDHDAGHERAATSSHQRSLEAVRRYYEVNTLWMSALGMGRGEAVLHRPVWAHGVRRRADALHFVEAQIASELGLAPTSGDAGGDPLPHVLDLGCGVGGSALWLAANFDVTITGITISPTQVRLAQHAARRRGLVRRCRFIEADFHNLPALPSAVGAYAIESFSHASDVARLVRQAAACLAEGGRLILVDDYLTDKDRGAALAARWTSRFAEGWHLSNLTTVDALTSIASEAGLRLVRRHALTPFLRPIPQPVLAMQLLLAASPLRAGWRDSLRGGTALQVCLANGWVQYWMLAFAKSNS